jgi:phosphoglycerate dehydrogenase-like enzyme
MTSSSRPRAFIAMRLTPEALARIDAACEAVLFDGKGMPSKDDLMAALCDCEGVLGSAQMPIDGEVIAAAPRLRVISNFGVGFDNVDLAAATARRIIVCNTPGVLTNAVADLTLALVLSLARRLPEAERFVREGRWLPGARMDLGSDVEGKLLGIVGLGRIGQAVAARAQAFGMRVCFYDLLQEPPEGAAFCVYSDLDGLLREADFISLHVNLSEETRHLIGERQLGLMKESAYLINTSRGQTVDQAALTRALEAGEIAGAALDVFEREPLAPDDPLLGLPNVIVLPHIGSGTRETRAAMLDLAIENLLAALRGQRPACVVNPEAW